VASDRRSALLGLVAVTSLALGGCTDIENAMASVPILNFMHESPALDPYEAPRTAPPNAVPVVSPGERWEPPVENTEAALQAWGDTMTNPFSANEAVLQAGAEGFMTYCAVCHGVGGVGDGPVVGQGKLPFATNLTLPTTAGRSDGYIYAIIRLGRGLMPSYRRIPPSQRWAIVHYVRHLQQGGETLRVDLPGQVMPGGGTSSAPAAAADTTGGGQE
jgi:mono/diheme cytochrome c family protein